MRFFFVLILGLTLRFAYAQNAQSFFDLYIQSVKDGNHKEAISHLNEAIRLDPTNWNYHRKRADTYTQISEYHKALADLNKAIDLLKYDEKLAPRISSLQLSLIGQKARLFEKQNERDSAIQAYTQFFELDPSFSQRWKGLEKRARLKVGVKDLTGAIEDYQMLTQLQPDETGKWYFAIGRLNADLKRYPEAIDAFTNAINNQKEVRTLDYFHRASTFTKMKDYESAIKDYDTILDIDPTNDSAEYHKEKIQSIIKRGG